ncbi:MAG TPA: hypothetical protein VMS77_04770 [Conexivisphaerales archaeon]|nr:hypothetical protein [Conexivisphaerales archaeon]
MTSEADEIAEERRRAKELKAFTEARERLKAKASEFRAEAEGQLSELKKRTVDGFKDL